MLIKLSVTEINFLNTLKFERGLGSCSMKIGSICRSSRFYTHIFGGACNNCGGEVSLRSAWLVVDWNLLVLTLRLSATLRGTLLKTQYLWDRALLLLKQLMPSAPTLIGVRT